MDHAVTEPRPSGSGTVEMDDFVMERMGRFVDWARSFDVAYWQRQGSNAIFAAARSYAKPNPVPGRTSGNTGVAAAS